MHAGAGEREQQPRLVAELEDRVHAVEVAAVERVLDVDDLRDQQAQQPAGDQQPDEALDGRARGRRTPRRGRHRAAATSRRDRGEVGGGQQRAGEQRRRRAPARGAPRVARAREPHAVGGRHEVGEQPVERAVVARPGAERRALGRRVPSPSRGGVVVEEERQHGDHREQQHRDPHASVRGALAHARRVAQPHQRAEHEQAGDDRERPGVDRVQRPDRDRRAARARARAGRAAAAAARPARPAAPKPSASSENGIAITCAVQVGEREREGGELVDRALDHARGAEPVVGAQRPAVVDQLEPARADRARPRSTSATPHSRAPRRAPHQRRRRARTPPPPRARRTAATARL